MYLFTALQLIFSIFYKIDHTVPEEKIEENELIKSSQVQDIQIVLDDIFPMISDLVYMYENLTISRFGISV